MFSPLVDDRANKQEKSSWCSGGSEGASTHSPGGAGGLSAQPVFAATAGTGICPFPELQRLQPWALQPCLYRWTAEMRGKRNANAVSCHGRNELVVIIAKCCSLQNQSCTQHWVSEAAFIPPLPQLRADRELHSRQWVNTSWAVIAMELTSDILLKIGPINPIISSSPACFASRVNTAD